MCKIHTDSNRNDSTNVLLRRLHGTAAPLWGELLDPEAFSDCDSNQING